MDLYKHNKEAYEKVMAAFNTSARAAIVHATGTGKSMVVGAVSRHFDKVLVIAPNNFVLNATRSVCKQGTEFRTYTSVMYGECGKYDLIVLDEFHRSGAEKWGEGVARLLAANPNAKVLGTTATEIRFLDNGRNMADEIFATIPNYTDYRPKKNSVATLAAFCEANGRIPNSSFECSVEERSLRDFLSKNYDNPEVRAIADKYGYVKIPKKRKKP